MHTYIHTYIHAYVFKFFYLYPTKPYVWWIILIVVFHQMTISLSIPASILQQVAPPFRLVLQWLFYAVTRQKYRICVNCNSHSMLSTAYVQIDHPTTTTVHNITAITATTTSTTNAAGIVSILYCIIIQYYHTWFVVIYLHGVDVTIRRMAVTSATSSMML